MISGLHIFAAKLFRTARIILERFTVWLWSSSFWLPNQPPSKLDSQAYLCRWIDYADKYAPMKNVQL